ncbi:hypothetical protein PR048_011558 [Dryococelus australis]|uniref:Uncharacterized protein n=1 Tax=Dryococelus australis TaxID=614101 RepID=A0ABQ9HLW8_9NEOP|nr:hypothetical protein PR048_011558 [Dryococelus australis]
MHLNTAKLILLHNCHNAVYNRFSDLHNAAVKILHVKIWPTDENQLSLFCVEEIKLLSQHYQLLLEKSGITEEGYAWADFKILWHHNLKHLSANELWKFVCKAYSSHFPNLCHIPNILGALTVSNAGVQRAVPTMKRVKTDYRNCLHT